MSSSSVKTHQLGRHFWASVRDSFDVWVWQSPNLPFGQHSAAGMALRRRFSSQLAPSRPRRRPTAPPATSVPFRRRGFFDGFPLFFSRQTAAAASPRGGGIGLGYIAGRVSPNNVRRSCTSGGLLLLGLSSPSSTSSTVVAATCSAAADSALAASTSAQKSGGILNGRALFSPEWILGKSSSGYQQPRRDVRWISTGPSHRRYKNIPSRPSNRSNRQGTVTSEPRRRASGNGRNRKVGAPPVPPEARTNRSAASAAAASAAKTTTTPKSKQSVKKKENHPPPLLPPPPPQQPSTPSTPPPSHDDLESIATSMSKYLQSHMPKIPHRPTKEELLAAATGFWQQMTVRLKWFSIRSMRPWNADEWGAFVSWVMLGHILWILVGTTTFFSLVIFTINTVFAQEELAKWVGDYLTQSAGITVVFESAIVPRWNDGVITFRNVFVSRRPGQVKSSVKKGSSSSAAAIAAARHLQDDAIEHVEEETDDGNYTQFDVTINSVDVTLSFIKWWNGKGLLKDVEVKGVRGVVDRTHIKWPKGRLDPFSYRHEHHPGDFEIERFKIEDLMVTMHEPRGFRPFSISIFSCELPQLRKQWLFYDFLCANHVSGSFDGSLFTIHPRQVERSMPGVIDSSHHNINNPVSDSMAADSEVAWKKFSRLRIDGLKIDHLNRNDRGPFGWIYEGNVDIVADVMFPAEPDEGIAKVMSDFYDKMEGAVTSNRYIRILDGNYGNSDFIGEGDLELNVGGGYIFSQPLSKPQDDRLGWNDEEDEQDSAKNDFGTNNNNNNDNNDTPSDEGTQTETVAEDKAFTTTPIPVEPLPQYVVMDLRLNLNDIRAAVPFFPPSDSLGQTRTQSYVNAALVRPIVAYMNAKRTYIPINCRIVKHLSDFDGSWTLYDCGLMDDASAEVYAAFARDVEDQQSRVRRLKKVGFWTLSMVVHALLAGVAGDLM